MNLSSLLGGAPGLPDPQAHVKPAAQSRFSQFFNRGGEQQQAQESRRSSIQDELLGANILKEIANKINDATGYVAKSLGLGKIIAWLLDTFYINFFLINIFGMKLVEVSAETETVVTETAETMEEPEQMRDEMEASEMMAV